MQCQEELLTRLQNRQHRIELLVKAQQEDIISLSKLQPETDYISVRVAARVFDVSTAHLYNLINSGKLSACRKAGKLFISKQQFERLQK